MKIMRLTASTTWNGGMPKKGETPMSNVVSKPRIDPTFGNDTAPDAVVSKPPAGGIFGNDVDVVSKCARVRARG